VQIIYSVKYLGMKKKILEALKNKYKNLGLGDKAFDGVATYIEPSVKEDTDIETAIAGVEVLLKAFQGEVDKLRTEKTAAEKSAADLVAQVKKLGGTPAQTEPGGTETGGAGNDLAQQITAAVQAAVKPLQDEITSLKSGKVAETRKQKLDAIISKLPENLRKSYARTPVKDLSEEDFETLTTEISAEVEELVKDNTAKGAVFGRPVGGGQQSKATAKEATDEEANSVVDRFNLG
jgi:hypothetical protein